MHIELVLRDNLRRVKRVIYGDLQKLFSHTSIYILDLKILLCSYIQDSDLQFAYLITIQKYEIGLMDNNKRKSWMLLLITKIVILKGYIDLNSSVKCKNYYVTK